MSATKPATKKSTAKPATKANKPKKTKPTADPAVQVADATPPDGTAPVAVTADTTVEVADVAPPEAPAPAAADARAQETAKPEAVAPTEAPTESPPAKTPRKTRGKKAAAAPVTSKKMSALDAAAKVLAEEGKPMNCKDLIDAMAARGYWSSPAGKTPEATLYAAMLREARQDSDRARFQKAGPGLFTLRNGN